MSSSAPSLFRGLAAAMSHPEHGWKTTHFWGPVANWGLVAAAVYDASFKGPEVIDTAMTGVMIGYSGLFMRFAWAVQPRNYLLFACHSFNVAAQTNQLRRSVEYKLANVADASKDLVAIGQKAALAGVALAGALFGAGPLQRALSAPTSPAFVRNIAGHAAGPFTIFFWAPTSKWFLSGTNLMNIDKPTNTISLAQTSALTATGFIWTRYSFVITPVNYNLAIVNAALGLSSGYHLMRKIKADYLSN